MNSNNEDGGQKTLVTVLLWGGALLAIGGLWWPNWVEALAGDNSPFLGLNAFRTPLIAYLGYLILWIACIMVVGISGSASGPTGWVGFASVALAAISAVLAQLMVSSSIILFIFTLTLFLATLFIYWTMERVTEIPRGLKRVTWLLNVAAFILGLLATFTGKPSSLAVLLTYALAGTYTLTWLVIAFSVLPSHYRYMAEKKRRMKNHKLK